MRGLFFSQFEDFLATGLTTVRTFLCVESIRWIRRRTTKNFFLLFFMDVIAKLMVISTRSPHDKILGWILSWSGSVVFFRVNYCCLACVSLH